MHYETYQVRLLAQHRSKHFALSPLAALLEDLNDRAVPCCTRCCMNVRVLTSHDTPKKTWQTRRRLSFTTRPLEMSSRQVDHRKCNGSERFPPTPPKVLHEVVVVILINERDETLQLHKRIPGFAARTEIFFSSQLLPPVCCGAKPTGSHTDAP